GLYRPVAFRRCFTSCCVALPEIPFRSFAPRSSSSNRLPTSFRVLSATTTLFGSATACKRAARFGVSQRWLAPEKRRTRSGRQPPPVQSRCRRASEEQRGSSDRLPQQPTPAPRARPSQRRPHGLGDTPDTRAHHRPCISQRSLRSAA